MDKRADARLVGWKEDHEWSRYSIPALWDLDGWFCCAGIRVLHAVISVSRKKAISSKRIETIIKNPSQYPKPASLYLGLSSRISDGAGIGFISRGKEV
jgi:hypothetical protein